MNTIRQTWSFPLGTISLSVEKTSPLTAVEVGRVGAIVEAIECAAGDRSSSPGEPVRVDNWPTLVALLRRLRRDAGAPEDESFGVPIPDEDLTLSGVLGVSWRDWPGEEARKALVLEEDAR